MTEETSKPASTEELGRSYAALLGARSWEVERGEDACGQLPSPRVDLSDSPPPPLRIIEALLFIGGEPLTATKACQIIRGLTPQQFTLAIDELNQAYKRQGRPYTIHVQEEGYVLTLRARCRGVIEKVYGGVREARLSTAAIDVLALVAYRQPATKMEIDSLRGAESGHLLRQLVRRGLVQVLYRADAERREVSYGTTPRFLELFGLRSLDELPRTQDLQQL